MAAKKAAKKEMTQKQMLKKLTRLKIENEAMSQELDRIEAMLDGAFMRESIPGPNDETETAH